MGTLILNGRNGDNGLLGSIPNVVEEDVTIIDEVENIHRKMYRFVGEWNDPAIYETIAEIID